MIDRSLVSGTPNRRVASMFGLTEASVRRHHDSHIPQALARAHTASEITRGRDLLEQVRTLQKRAEGILAAAWRSGQLGSANGALREARECLALQAKLLGELDESPKVAVLVSAEWLQVRQVILDVLGAYPAARAELAARLRELEGPRELEAAGA